MARSGVTSLGVWCVTTVGFLVVASPAWALLGDLDCSGSVTIDDVSAFVLALVDPAGYETAYPGCDITQADMNDDGSEDGKDIPGFVAALLGGGPTEPPTAVELAGNSLSAYPYFEYVKAFNEDATVELAIDPTRFPEIVGTTGNIYVVEPKTAEQWQTNPALVDVTSGGPQTETFGGSTIQDNTFLVIGPYEISADAGSGLGVGYDMVIDSNQNGILDGGDYIDGLSTESGLYWVHDTTTLGSLAVTELSSYSVGAVFGIPSGMTYENAFYPTDIPSMGELPLIIISHGNGHNYQWYDHIGYHMASYGYVVMSHQNNTGPGPEQASLTTLGHTDAFIDQLDTIGGGVLEGHVDMHCIVWIGHGRGGEGVVIAYDRIVDDPPSYTPTHYTAEDIVLISSMMPTDFMKTEHSNPHGANYHLWTAVADLDVPPGGAGSDLSQTFHLHDRATGFRQSTIVHGTVDAWFHNGGGVPSSPPCPIYQQGTHLVLLGHLLPLIKYYAEGNIPAHDFLWRQYERFHPIGAPVWNPCLVVTHEHRNGAQTGNFMIDDYQTAYDDTHLSSHGGPVSYTVQNVEEGRLDDNNSDFGWTPTDPFNGATQCSSSGSDDSRGVVFDWNGGSSYYEWGILPAYRNFSEYKYLSCRGAQGTQHPYTLAVMGDETFSVTLRDGDGTTSSINIGAYGGGLEQPHVAGGGWHNEMEIIRIRLTDYLHNNPDLDLTDIEAVRFDCGPTYGSNEGRIVADELMLTNDPPPV